MDDRCIMENLLLTTKGVCDLYLHGTIESSTQDVRQSFDQALNNSLCMQDDIYKKNVCQRLVYDRAGGGNENSEGKKPVLRYFINSDLNRNPDLQNPLLLFSR